MRHSALLAVAFSIVASPLFAQTSSVSTTTDPVGVFNFTALGASDTFISLPLHRPTVFQGTVSTVSGNTVTVSGSPAWTVNQFAYAAGTQSNYYYAQFAGGAKEGLYFTVTSNTDASITVSLSGDTLAAVAAGDAVRIIPYWSLNTVFPAGAGFKPSPSFTPVSTILFPDHGTAGVNLSPATQYFYYSGAAFGGAGWRQVGGAAIQKFDDQPILPDSYFIVRHTTTGDVTFSVSGEVQVHNFKSYLSVLSANTMQDNAVALNLPTAMTLTQSNLVQSGSFAPSTSFTPVDTLLVFDNTVTGFDKAASEQYFYYSGAAFGGAGWRKVGGTATAIYDTTAIFQPGRGYIIRKGAVATPQSTVWAANKNY